MNEVAIVILNYNGQNYLEKFLPAVLSYSEGEKVIVADNASTDHSVSWLNSNYPEVEIINNTENNGYSGGYNYALSKLDYTYYILLNSDVEVTPGWLGPMLKLFKENPDIAAIQPKILSYNEKSTFEYAGAGGGFIDKFGFPFCRGRIFHSFEKDSGQYDDSREIFWASGACLFIRSKDFHEAGGFDEEYFAHMEEIDLCWRLHYLGKRVFYEGKSTIYHVGGGTLAKTNPRKTYLNFRNGLSMLFKNSRKVLPRMMVRSMLDVIAMCRFLILLEWQHAWAIVRAHLYFWSTFKGQLNKRNSFKPLIRIHDVNRIYPESVVWEYFVRGNKLFKNLKHINRL